ncbi:hypothetical protein XSP_003129 [Xanthomonas euroxanthea]|uniref:Uncharacterized protein n=1 Tax=Xanthomonas euroxanthea TaxID=2259622 RepID=A0A8E4H151_9XANT|nr:hypothetical protein [Xanthomonas euroxanthea]CAD1794891.1 hypothetical protein XSP_003129 [Xanthomonas euroxanthea]
MLRFEPDLHCRSVNTAAVFVCGYHSAADTQLRVKRGANSSAPDDGAIADQAPIALLAKALFKAVSMTPMAWITATSASVITAALIARSGNARNAARHLQR